MYIVLNYENSSLDVLNFCFVLQMWRWSPALQSTSRRPGEILLVGGKIQLAQRTGRLPSLHICFSVSGYKITRHGAWRGEFISCTHMRVFFLPLGQRLSNTFLYEFPDSFWCRHCTISPLKNQVSWNSNEVTSSLWPTVLINIGGPAKLAPAAASFLPLTLPRIILKKRQCRLFNFFLCPYLSLHNFLDFFVLKWCVRSYNSSCFTDFKT